MAHQTTRDAYDQLVGRLNRPPQGAPPSELLYQILQMLVSVEEARLVALLPIKAFSAQRAAKLWHMEAAEAERILDGLAGRAILLDMVDPAGQKFYNLPPPMAGFFEFSMMRVRGDINQKVLAELFYEYITVEDEFITALFANGETQLGRVFVQEATLPAGSDLYVLDYERASEVIQTASHRAIGLCYCRHKMLHVDRACDAPLDICMTFNNVAAALARHGFAREVEAAEGLELLQQAQENNLVQFGENVRQGVNFICNCCGCCCEAMIAGRKFGFMQPIHTTNFIPRIEESLCNGCGRCANACPVEAMTLVSANDPHRPKLRKARLNEDLCLGCGVCVRTCSKEAIRLDPRPARVLTPVDTVHRTVVMAIERGMLADLIFDNRSLASHRAMAAILGAILKLPPLKQTLASEQVRSHYLERLLAWGRERIYSS